MKNWIKASMLSIMLALMMFVSSDAKAQVNVSAGVFIQNDNAIENLEVGKTIGRNTISLLGQSYVTPLSTERQWSAGVKYYRELYSYQDQLSVKFNASTQLNLVGKNQYIVVQPGFNVVYNLSKKVGLSIETSSPIYEGTNLFKPVNWQTGINLVLTL